MRSVAILEELIRGSNVNNNTIRLLCLRQKLKQTSSSAREEIRLVRLVLKMIKIGYSVLRSLMLDLLDE